MLKLVTGGNFFAVFPETEFLVDDAEHPRQPFLISPLASSRLEHHISSCFFASRVVAEEGDDRGPLGHDRLSFVTLPALVDFAQGAYLPGNILLPNPQHQPAIAKVLAESLRVGNKTFLVENERFECLCSYPDRKKAKRQNRVIYIIRKLARYGGAAGQCDPRSRAR